jgi:hypothetical protein
MVCRKDEQPVLHERNDTKRVIAKKVRTPIKSSVQSSDEKDSPVAKKRALTKHRVLQSSSDEEEESAGKKEVASEEEKESVKEKLLITSKCDGVYDPSKGNYDAIKDACWKADEK